MRHLTDYELIHLAMDAHDNPLAKLLAERFLTNIEDTEQEIARYKEVLTKAESTRRSLENYILQLRTELFQPLRKSYDSLTGRLVIYGPELDEIRNRYAPDMEDRTVVALVVEVGQDKGIWVTDSDSTYSPYSMRTLYTRVW